MTTTKELTGQQINPKKLQICSKEKNYSARFWPIIALLSGVSFSLHNEFFFSQSKETTKLGVGAAVLLPYWIGELPIVLIYIFYNFFNHYKKHKTLWSKSTSKYYKLSKKGNPESLSI